MSKNVSGVNYLAWGGNQEYRDIVMKGRWTVSVIAVIEIAVVFKGLQNRTEGFAFSTGWQAKALNPKP